MTDTTIKPTDTQASVYTSWENAYSAALENAANTWERHQKAYESYMSQVQELCERGGSDEECAKIHQAYGLDVLSITDAGCKRHGEIVTNHLGQLRDILKLIEIATLDRCSLRAISDSIAILSEARPFPGSP
jgi:hypothetical protein